MAVFKDSRGDEWILKLTVQSARRVKEATGISLFSGDCLHRLAEDPTLCADVVFHACRAEDRGETLETFGERIADTDALNRLVRAVVEALADFSPARAATIKRAWADIERQGEMALEKMTGEMETTIAAMRPSSNSAESPASLPTVAG